LFNLFFWIYRRRRAKRRMAQSKVRADFSTGSFNDHERQFIELLAEFDRKLSEGEWSRPPNWTPLEIAKHLESGAIVKLNSEECQSLAAFARDFGKLRFQGRPPSSEELAQLSAKLQSSQ